MYEPIVPSEKHAISIAILRTLALLTFRGLQGIASTFDYYVDKSFKLLQATTEAPNALERLAI